MIPSELLDAMDSGVIYDPADPSLTAIQRERIVLVAKYNASDPRNLDQRYAMLKHMFASVGESVGIEAPMHANWGGMKVHIGSHVYINFLCTFVDDAPIFIEDHVMIGPRVTLATATHPIDPEARRKGLQYNKPIHILENAWIGAGAIINPGVTIGRSSVIGAGSVVTHDIPDNVVAYGIPARVVKRIE